jgi:hypothetical protein
MKSIGCILQSNCYAPLTSECGKIKRPTEHLRGIECNEHVAPCHKKLKSIQCVLSPNEALKDAILDCGIEANQRPRHEAVWALMSLGMLYRKVAYWFRRAVHRIFVEAWLALKNL